VAMTPEGRVKAVVRKMLDATPGAYHFCPATVGYGRSGVPDIVGCYRGKFFAIEVKAGSNQPTTLQHKELAAIAKSQGEALVINENNTHEVQYMLERLRRGF